MRKILLLFWRIWFYTLGALPVIILFPLLAFFLLFSNGYRYLYWVARNIWSNIIMYGMGFYPEIKFKQHIKKGKSYMLVSNHKSMIDIMLMLSLSKDPIVFVGKKELEKIPLFGYFYRRVCILVDRSSPESRKEVYTKAIKRLDTGISVCIFPEGGVPDPSVILDKFKNGAFSLAIQFQIPIVPITFLDCEKKFPYFFAYNHFYGSPGKLRANVHEFIETKGLNQENKEVLKEKVYDILHKDLLSNSSQN